MKEYQTIDISIGSSIEDAVKLLQKCKETGVLAKIDFNGHILYSDTVALDSAYLEIIGKTFEEFKDDKEKSLKQWKKQKRDHKKALPQKIKSWIEKGKGILDNKYWDKWIEIVPIRGNDLYQGLELDASLEAVDALNKGLSFKEVSEILINQCHSGGSHHITCSLIHEFADRGKDFVEWEYK